jgi:flagellar basal-body rod protein FlgB
MSKIADSTMQALAAAANMRHLKQQVIAGNIANAETPGYHAKKMDFEDALARALDLDGLRSMSTSDAKHFSVGGGSLSKISPDIYDNPEASVNNDGNTVNLEKEMAALAENTILHKAALQLINKKLAALRYAATEGR